jgi:hypothetical protein
MAAEPHQLLEELGDVDPRSLNRAEISACLSAMLSKAAHYCCSLCHSLLLFDTALCCFDTTYGLSD